MFLIVVIKLLLPIPTPKVNKDKNKITFHLKAMTPRLHKMRRRKGAITVSKPGHDISECQKRKASGEKKKQAGLSVTTSTQTLLNMSRHSPYTWCMIPQRMTHVYQSVSLRILGILIVVLLSTWPLAQNYATLEDVCHKAGTVSCANNTSYIIKGIGQVHITAVNGDIVTLNNVLSVPGIKKNLLSVFSIAMC